MAVYETPTWLSAILRSSKKSKKTRVSRGSQTSLPSSRSSRVRPSQRSNRSHASRNSNAPRSARRSNATTTNTTWTMPAERGWRRFVSFIGYHHLLMILITVGMVFFSLVSAGCVVHGLRDIYLLSLSYATPDQTSNSNVSALLASAVGNASHSLEVRVGFIGACAKLPSGWSCSPKFNTIINRVSEVSSATVDANATSSYDPLGLVHLGKSFRDQIIFDGLMFIAVGCSFIGLCILIIIGAVGEEAATVVSSGSELSSGSARSSSARSSKKDMERKLSLLNVTISFTLVAAIMALLSVFWQHLGSSGVATMVAVMTNGAVRTGLGSVAMGLGWATVFIYFLVFIGSVAVRLSIVVISRIIEDE